MYASFALDYSRAGLALPKVGNLLQGPTLRKVSGPQVTTGISVHSMVKNPPIDRMAALVALLGPMVSEFVIVDTGSSRNDIDIMKNWGKPSGAAVKVVEEEFTNFSETRNKGLALHEYEWTLGIDPDEIPSFAMMEHIKYVTSPEGMAKFPQARGWVYWTYNWWGGRLGDAMDYHWHTRLWKTNGSKLYRPIHELVIVQGEDELELRRSPKLPYAPREAYLIHSKSAADIEKDDKFYDSMGGTSR